LLILAAATKVAGYCSFVGWQQRLIGL